jgi:hypothetical protein
MDVGAATDKGEPKEAILMSWKWTARAANGVALIFGGMVGVVAVTLSAVTLRPSSQNMDFGNIETVC